MSDQEPDVGTGDTSGDHEATGDDLSGVSDPALASGLETIHRSMSTLGMRIDALVTSTTTYRSALTDRLNEYADLVTKLTRTQASDLEEYRRANERTLSDLRRGLATSEETLERVGARIDSMLTDSESADDSSRRVLAEVRSILEAQENLGRFLTESLDQFGEQVIGRLATSEQAASQQLEALQAAVSDVDATPDPSLGLLDGRLATIEDRLSVVASNDSAAALGSRFDTLHAALDELGRQVADGGEPAAVIDRLTRVEDELASNGKVATESFGEIAGLRAKVDAILETEAAESGAVTASLEQLKETLQDLASGEVVGALWDEVRQMRATIEALVDRDEHATDPAGVEALRTDVTDLTGSVRQLLEQAEVVDDEEPAPVTETVDRPSPEILAELGAVRSGVEDIIGRLDEGFDLETEVVPVETSPELADQVATLRDQVRAELEQVRHLVEDRGEAVDLTPLTARLDRLHDDIADQQALGAPVADAAPALDLTEVLESLGDIQEGLAHLLDRPVPTGAPESTPPPAPAGDGYATVDPDVVDLLREEIRAAGATGDELVETLAGELKALRRRIRLRAEGEIFSEAQLEVIAEAVARRLAD